MTDIQWENVPEELINRKIWVLWKAVPDDDGKIDKMPWKADGSGKLAWSKENNRMTFVEAKAKFENDNGKCFAGVGFIIPERTTNDLELAVEDLDDAIVDNEINNDAKKLLANTNSYSELSPSRKGIHIISLAANLKDKKNIGRKHNTPVKYGEQDVEIFIQKHFVTFTGWRLDEYPASALDRTDEVCMLYSSMTETNEPKTTTIIDDEIARQYVEAALEDEAKLVRTAKRPTGNSKGERNDTLNIAALKIGRFVPKWIDAAEVERTLLRAATANGMKTENARATIKSGLTAGMKKPQDPPRLERNAKYLEEHGTWVKQENIRKSKDEEIKKPIYREVTSEELEQCGLDTNPRLELNLPEKNFIMKFLKYGKQCSDAYDEIWIAGAITILSTLTHRNIELKMKHGIIKTNTWCQCIGKSSATRKSTVISKVELILKTVGTINCLPDDMSPEAMVDVLSEDPRAYMLADESASVMEGFKKDYQKGMKDVLMKMYDGKDFVRRLRPKKNQPNIFVVTNPFLTVLMATTPTRYAASTQEEDKMSGWFQRFIYFYPNADNEDWRPMLEEAEEDITAEMDCIATASYIKEKVFDLNGSLRMRISKDGTNFFNNWQRKMDKECKKLKNDSIEGVYNRLPVYALKLAMLFEIGNMERDSEIPTTISLEMVEEACRVTDEFFIPMALIVEKIIGKSVDKNLMDRMLAILTTRGGKETRRNLMRSLHAKMKDMDDAIEALVFANEVELVTETRRGGTVTWVVMENEVVKTPVTTLRKMKNEKQLVEKKGLPEQKLRDDFQPIYIQQNNNNIHIIDKEENKDVTCHVENVNDKEKENRGKTTGQLDNFGAASRFEDVTTKDEIDSNLPESNVVVTPLTTSTPLSHNAGLCNSCGKPLTGMRGTLVGIGEVCMNCQEKALSMDKKRKITPMMKRTKGCKFCGNPNAVTNLPTGGLICMKCSQEGKDRVEYREKRKQNKPTDKAQRTWR